MEDELHLGRRRRRPHACDSGCGDAPDCDLDCLPDLDCAPGCDCVPDCNFAALLLGLLAVRGPTRAPRSRPSAAGRAGMAAIRGYQRWISPRLPTRCRHTPSCSAYGLTAVGRYGLVAGSRLTAGRIRRCTAPTPYGTVDPVP